MVLDFYNIVGFMGVFFILIAYGLLQTNKINQGIEYTILNFIGASFVMISLIGHWNFPSFFLEFIWIVLSLIGLKSLIKNKNKFITVHIVLNEHNKYIPTHYLIIKNNTIEKILDYNDKELQIIKGTYF